MPYAVQPGQERPIPRLPEESADDWIECPCGEFCLLAELQDHLDLHGAEGTNFDDIDFQGTDMTASIPVRGGRASSPNVLSPDHDSLQYIPYPSSVSVRGDSYHDQKITDHGNHEHQQQPQVPSPTESMRMSSVEPMKSIATSKIRLKSARLGVGGPSNYRFTTTDMKTAG